jgi:acid stress-induced BolA-like protein IbaG/YrbA
MQPNDIKNLIEQAMPGAQIIVQGDDGVHFEAVVISEAFAGKNLIQQHRLVNAALKKHIESGDLHALSFKTYTPDAWQAAQSARTVS